MSAVHPHTDHSTAFVIGDATLIVESLWRVRVAGAIRSTSEDHGQRFGHSTPVDATGAAFELLANKIILAVEVDDRCADLAFTVEGDTVLEVLTTSAGYESWELRAPNQHFVAISGGTVQSLKA